MAGVDPLAMPGALVHGHAPFVWGVSVAEAVEHASLLEEVAQMAYHTIMLNSDSKAISQALHSRHFERKHGAARYYGQL